MGPLPKAVSVSSSCPGPQRSRPSARGMRRRRTERSSVATSVPCRGALHPTSLLCSVLCAAPTQAARRCRYQVGSRSCPQRAARWRPRTRFEHHVRHHHAFRHRETERLVQRATDRCIATARHPESFVPRDFWVDPQARPKHRASDKPHLPGKIVLAQSSSVNENSRNAAGFRS